MKAVEHYLKPDVCNRPLERKTITNIKFYVATSVGVKLLGAKEGIADKLAQTPAIIIDNAILEEALEEVLQKYNDLGASDQVAKGTALVAQLLS